MNEIDNRSNLSDNPFLQCMVDDKHDECDIFLENMRDDSNKNNTMTFEELCDIISNNKNDFKNNPKFEKMLKNKIENNQIECVKLSFHKKLIADLLK